MIVVLLPGFFAGNLNGTPRLKSGTSKQDELEAKANADLRKQMQAAGMDAKLAGDQSPPPRRLDPYATSPLAGDAPPPATQDPFAYSTSEANDIYAACVGVAESMWAARGLQHDCGSQALWLIEAINGRVRHFGERNQYPAHLVVMALGIIKETVEGRFIRGADLGYAQWKLSDVEFVERALPLIFRFGTGGPSVRPTAGAVGEGDLEEEEEIIFPEGILVKTAGGTVHLDTGGGRSPYEIAISRIPTPEALLGWIQHLQAKTWVTGEHIVQFIHEVASRQKGWRFSTTSKA